ncbi:MAG TPA: hypothetical protein VNW72_00915 [Chthoniobacterales bacterium]|jgi:hypothetical protein|nr:hypothetical protein [Chthoniobacterales bacterium]
MSKRALSILSLACRAVALGVGGSILGGVCSADQRHFTFVYEATIEEPGEFELESWVTGQIRKGSDHSFSEADLRHEIEFGVIGELQASVYLTDWSYVSSKQRNGFVFSDAALELVYQIYNPEKAPIGLALYKEVEAGDQIFGSESKLIVQKNVGPVLLVYNTTLEAVWQGKELAEHEAKFEQSIGASYQVSRCVSLGAEFVHETAFPEWSHAERPVISGGPNLSIHEDKWWATFTTLAQFTRARDEPDFLLRAIVGYSF